MVLGVPGGIDVCVDRFRVYVDLLRVFSSPSSQPLAVKRQRQMNTTAAAPRSYLYGERVHTRHDRVESEARQVSLTFPFTASQSSRRSLLLHPSPPPHLDCSLSLSTTLPTALVVVLRGLSALFGLHYSSPTATPTSASSLPCRRCRRLAHPVDQQMALLALDHLYADDGPGELYVQGRRNPNGRLEFKVGETSSMPCRYGEYSRCTKNGHTLEWEFHCQVPYRKLAERLIHLSFGALGGVLVRYPCPGCYVRHREFYSLDNIGDLDAVVRIMSFWIVAIGGTFDQLPMKCFHEPSDQGTFSGLPVTLHRRPPPSVNRSVPGGFLPQLFKFQAGEHPLAVVRATRSGLPAVSKAGPAQHMLLIWAREFIIRLALRLNGNWESIPSKNFHSAHCASTACSHNIEAQPSIDVVTKAPAAPAPCAFVGPPAALGAPESRIDTQGSPTVDGTAASCEVRIVVSVKDDTSAGAEDEDRSFDGARHEHLTHPDLLSRATTIVGANGNRTRKRDPGLGDDFCPVCSLSIVLLGRLILNLHEAAAVGMTTEEPNTIELETLRFATGQTMVNENEAKVEFGKDMAI
ncbi:hypothetical protein C8R45DRAFT_1115515 [Mycena sanguinolenta]|nr:hypothetical protein C8R45DRAFT_1115515 [Mycena sanguinolenta]